MIRWIARLSNGEDLAEPVVARHGDDGHLQLLMEQACRPRSSP